MSVSSCLAEFKLADSKDKSLFDANRKEYREDGLNNTEAAKKAADEVIEAIKKDYLALESIVNEKGGVLPPLPEHLIQKIEITKLSGTTSKTETRDDVISPDAPKTKPIQKPNSERQTEKAQNQFDKDMAELGGAIFEVLSMKVIPSEKKPDFTRLLTNVMASSLNLGYIKFKENAKYVLDAIAEKFGQDAADLFDLQMLQGAYLGATSGEKGAESIADVGKVTLDDINNTEVKENVLLHDNVDRISDTGRLEATGIKGSGGNISPENSSRKGTGDSKGTKRKPFQTEYTRTESDHKPSNRSGAAKYQGRSRDDLRHNHRIESQNDLASGSAYQIAKTNLDAIKIAKRIASSNNDTALPEEQAILAKYAGWGASDIRNKVFPKNNKPEGRWKEIYNQLDEMLTSAEMKTLKKSTQYAHYTTKSVIDAMYKAIEGFGFKTGSIFEGGVGSGNFMGLIPQKFNIPSYTGVEMDSITADIAQALYPDNRVIKGDFTKINLPPNHFDLVIGNPPFADVRYPLGGQKMMIHDYMIAKQLNALRPGAVAAFVTSTGTMDKNDSSVREYIAANSVLLGAVRLPNDAFKASAGTGVTTDVLFFQKKDPNNDSIKGVDWIDTGNIKTKDGNANINDYFNNNPEQMLGTPELGGTFQNRFALTSNGNTEQQLNDAVAALPKNVVAENPTVEEIQARSSEFEIAPAAVDSYYYTDKAGITRINQGGVGISVQNRNQHGRGKTAKQMEMIKDYIPLRDALIKVMREQKNDTEWKKAIKELNTQYDNFTNNHGFLNQVKEIKRKDGVTIYQQPVTTALEDDAEFFRVLTTEQYDDVSNTGTKGNVFTNQLFGKEQSVKINSAEDALSVTLNEKGYIDMDHIQKIYDHSEKDIVSELGMSVFTDPLTNQLITADEYLSGNVKAKLRQAKEAGTKKNIEALEKVIPEDKLLSEIPINLGAFWISPETIERFAEEVMDFSGKISNVIRGETSSWSVHGTAENTADFGTAEKSPENILNAALNRITIKITHKDSDGKIHVLVAESTAANEKVKELKEAFLQWALNDGIASRELHEVYNRDFNTTVPRKYNGDMLTLPGLSSKYALHYWQKNVAWRIIQNGNTYMAHTVGAGKTLASIVAGMELKRLGLAKKPAYVVLKSTLKQFAAEFYDAYPNAKLLIADENQLNPRNRRHFMGKVANENWDAVIMTHQSFEKIPMSDEFVTSYIEQQIAEYQATLEELDENDLPNRRNIENTIEKMEAQLEEVAKGEGKDKGVTFEDAGIDHLFVDEAHKHKKVQFPTSQYDMKGIDPNGSKIAMDLFLKSRYLNTIKPNKNLVMMSGTAVTNTINEFFNIQRYLQPDLLEQQGISSFDSWSATFAESSTNYEMKANGEFKPVTRLNKFVGLPGFLRDFLQVADIVGDKELEESTTIKNRPTLKNNARDIRPVPIGESMKEYMSELDDRIKALEGRKGPPKKGEDNILVVMNDGQNAAIDMRLVNKKNDVPSKLDVMITEAFETWQETADSEYHTFGKPDVKTGSVQLIFTKTRKSSKSSFDVYNHIRDTLISKGVPAEQIAFIQNYGDSKKKKRLFNDVNNGKIRFVLGGTDNLGTGTNVQKRLSKIHHLSIDYRPSDLKQREGRMIRQGNQNENVESIAYAAEGTIDAFMWGMLESKASMIDKAMAGDLSVDRISDVSDDANMLAMAKAIASGNPALLEIAELSSDVKRLRMMENSFANQRFNARKTLRDVERSEQQIAFWKEQTSNLPKYKETSGDKFNAELNGKKYSERSKFLDALNTLPGQKAGMIGKVGNMDIFIDDSKQLSFNEHKDVIFINGSSLAKSYNLNIEPVILTGLLSLGAVKRLENVARKYSNVPQDMKAELDKVNKRGENAERILNSEFDKTEELNTKQIRLLDLEDSLKSLEPESKLGEADEVPKHSNNSDAGDLNKDVTEIIDSSFSRKNTLPLKSKSTVAQLNKRLRFKLRKLSIPFKPVVVQSISDLPKDLLDNHNVPNDVRGVAYKGKSYLVADNIKVDEAHRVLQHEVIGHTAMEVLLGNDFNQLIELIGRLKKRGDKQVVQVLEEIKSSYIDNAGQYNLDKTQEAREIIAHIAEKNKTHIIVRKIIGFIKKALAKIGYSSIDNADLYNTLTDAIGLAENTGKSYYTSQNGRLHSFSQFENNANFSRTQADKRGKISDALAPAFESDFIQNTKSAFDTHKWGILNVRQIADVLGKYAPIIKNKYIDRFKRFEADTNEMKQIAGNIANARQDLSKVMNESLADVQHSATIEQYDPSSENPDSMTGSNNDISRGDDEIVKRQEIKDKYDELSADAKEIYSKELNYHTKMHNDRLKYLIARINSVEGDEDFKMHMVEKLHVEFNNASTKGPYFPLSRFGKFWVSGEVNGEETFDMFENEMQQKRFIEVMRSDPSSEVNGFGKKLDDVRSVNGVSGQFMSDLDKIMRKFGDDPIIEQMRDDAFQLYLETLPEMSARKKYLHRGKVKGYARDQARAFAQKARADANDIARLKHIHVLEDMIARTEIALNIAGSNKLKAKFSNHVGALQKVLDDTPFEISEHEIKKLNRTAPFKTFQLNQTGNPEAEIERILKKEKELLENSEKITEDKITFVSNGLNELKKSHAAMINKDVHPIAAGLNSLGFLWYLGASPAAALVNLTQTPTVALPMMLANKNLKNPARHLGKAMKDFIKGKGSIESTLNADEKRAFQEWYRSGLLENTQAHDLSGVADSGIDTGTFKNKAMRAISLMFHRAEVMNREVTALATYRAAKQGGMSSKSAVKLASDLTWKSHLDYGASNRARFMRGNTMRVITQFKQYSQGITYIYAKTINDAFKGETKADKVQARKMLGMLIAGQLSVAGSLGLPMAGVVMGMTQGVADALGDDDDAVSMKAEYRQWLSDLFGKTGGQILSHGLIDTFTPLSVSGRLSMADLWIRTPDYDQEGKAEALSYIEALGGPMVSIFTNMFMAKESLADGNYLRAAEQSVPKFIKDVLRTTRYATEGNLTKSGLEIKDMSVEEMIGQVFGFSSSEVSEIRERATQIKNVEKKRATRRSEIIKNWRDSASKDMSEIRAWNAKYPNDRITRRSLKTSVKSKHRYSSQYVKGVRETRRNRDLIKQYDY